MENTVSAEQVVAFTRKKICGILARPDRTARALAELRRGTGKHPGELPALWEYYFGSMPQAFYGKKEPSRAEWAVYTALTLFAVHQQGRDPCTDPMHQEGIPLGTALSGLVKNPEDEERVIRHFNCVVTAGNMEAVSFYMRNIICLLAREGIALDYAWLAGDLYRFQFPGLTNSVRLRWGQDFYRGFQSGGDASAEEGLQEDIVTIEEGII